jgi:hypothetical protein
MVWVASERFQGWACSVCEWKFNPSNEITGSSLTEMALDFERQRDEEFESHVCAAYPNQNPASDFEQPLYLEISSLSPVLSSVMAVTVMAA